MIDEHEMTIYVDPMMVSILRAALSVVTGPCVVEPIVAANV
jgi:hypothetical protein